MLVFLSGMLWFFVTFAVHLLLWRILKAKSPERLLLAVAGGVTVSGIVLESLWVSSNFFNLGYSGVLCFSIVGGYLITLNGIAGESPSCLIILKIHEAGALGVTREDLKMVVTDETFGAHRIDGLIAEGFVNEQNGQLFITARGRVFLEIFLVYHRWTNRLKLGG